MGFLVNIDNGGTFTDVCISDGSRMVHAKSTTTPHDLTQCFMEAMKRGSRELFGEDDLARLIRETDCLRYSTTSGTNAVVDLQGIDITTLPGQAVRTVFGGSVESVMPVPGQGKMVILSHGNYYTVYANMENVSVKAGDKIDGLKTIGTARTDPGTGETKVHFQVYKDRTPMDPETWLVRKN